MSDQNLLETKVWRRHGLTVTATIDRAFGNHTVEFHGMVCLPMYWPGDAFDAHGNEVQIPKPHGRMHVEEMMREAYSWIAKNAPRKTRPRRSEGG